MSTPNYAWHGGNHMVSVVYCPNILGQRLAHLSQDGQLSWVLRDYITGRMLRCAPPPNQSDSGLPLTQIEARVERSELPPYYNAKNGEEWATYLRLRTLAVLRIHTIALDPPNSDYGNWRRMW